MEERISTYEGKLIRVNRSIQAEGVFAMTKEDMGFRRVLLRSAVKVEVEWTLLSLAYNILKLHHKIQKQRSGALLICGTLRMVLHILALMRSICYAFFNIL